MEIHQEEGSIDEIEAEFKCKIVEIVKDDASPVEYGETLFLVERVWSAEPADQRWCWSSMLFQDDLNGRIDHVS